MRHERCHPRPGLANDSIWWSEGLQTLFGHDPALAAETPGWWLANVHPDDRERIQESPSEVLRSGRTQWREEFRFGSVTGGFTTALDRGFIMSDDTSTPHHMNC